MGGNGTGKGADEMKKKCALSIIAVWLIMLITACAPSEPRASGNNFYVILNVKNDIKSIIYEYSLGVEPMGGCEIMNARTDMPIPEGDRVYINFRPESFEYPEKLRKEIFRITFTIADENGTYTLPYSEWFAGFGCEYEFTLEKDGNGYTLSPTDGAADD